MASTMNVVRYYPPGSFEKLAYQSEPVPSPPSDNEAIVKVSGVGLIHPELTWPIYTDASGAYAPHIPGHDFAGTISALGASYAGDLKVGDEVYGLTSRRNHEGAMAEFVKADLDQIVRRPKNITPIEAASVPLSALTAWQALFDHGNLQAGQKVLVTGAAGGTGVWAVQFAKLAKAEVIATGSSKRSQEILEGYGVDRFVNYRTEDVTKIATDVDLVVDCVGGAAFQQGLDVVKQKGKVVSIVDLDCVQKAKDQGREGVFFIVSMNAKELDEITGLIEGGKVKVLVDAVYPLAQTREAFEEAAKGHVHGKVVIKVA